MEEKLYGDEIKTKYFNLASVNICNSIYLGNLKKCIILGFT